MWNLLHGKSNKAASTSSQVSDPLEHQDDNSKHRNIAPTAPSVTASTSSTKRKKHSSRRKEDRDPFPDSISGNNDNPDRSIARAGTILSKASSYVTARGQGDDDQVVGGPGGEMSGARPSRDDTIYSRQEVDRKESGTSERRRRKSSPTGKRTKDSDDRKERRSRDAVNGERDSTGGGGRRRQDPASKKYDLVRGSDGETSRGPGDFSGQIAGTGFTQFPGQYEGAPQGAFTVPASHHEAASSHVQDQFPGQFPAESSAPYRPPLASTEGGPGLAAEYYGDAGQSVADQPGYRKHSPSLIIGAEPHLQPASSVAAPPPEPSQMGATGAAASFYSGEFEDATPSTAHTTSKPYNTAPSRPNGALYTSSAPVVPTLAGATAGAAAGYMMSGGLSSSQHVSEHGSSISGSHGHISQPPNQDQTSASQTSFYAPSNKPSRPSKPPSQPSNVPLFAAGAAGAAGLAAASYAHHQNHSSQSVSTTHQHPSTPMQQRHRHRGPFGALVDFVKDPDGVAQFEEYSEIIGVCRGCFEPGSSPRDAPRKHRFYKRRSKERLGSNTRVDKQHRYSSSDDESRRKNGVSWIGAGLAGYGLGKVGETLFNRKNDFDDSSDVKSGRLSPRRRLSPSRRSYDQTLRRRTSSKEELRRRDSNDALSYRKRDHGGSYAVTAGSAMSKQRPSASGLEFREQSTKTSQSASIRPEPSVTVASVSAEQRRHQKSSPSILRRNSQDEEVVPVDGSRKRRDKRKGRRKDKGFFSFLSPSSNSSASSLELSSRPEKSGRRRRKGSTDRIKNNHEAEAAILGLSAATAALALHNGRSKKGRKGSAHQDSKKRRKRTSSASSDDTWESASEVDLSHVDSDLAFGSNSSNVSHDSLVSISPVMMPRRDALRDDEIRRGASNPNVTLPTHNATSTTSVPPVTSTKSRDRYDTIPETIAGPMPLQMVYPVPTSDPGRFDVQREESVASSKPPTTTSRPSPVPIQQPQPIVPVSSSFYSSQGPGDRIFNCAEESDRISKSSDPVSLHKVSSEPSVSRYEAFRDGARRDDDFQHRSLKRRDTSPARLAEDELSTSIRPSQAGTQKDESSTVRFAMTQEQEEQDRLERRRRRREERESGERRETRRRGSEDRVVKERDVSDLPAKTINEGSNASWVAPAAGIAGAAVAAAAMSAKSDKEESREERRDRRRREREREDEEEAAAKSEHRRRKERQRRQEDADENGADEPDNVAESQITPAVKHQPESAEDASSSSRHSVWQEAGAPKQTAHEDYQSFFTHAVTDILNKSGDQAKVTSADPDADVSADKEVAIVEIAPKKRIRAPDEPEFSPADTDERLDTSRRWPWRVPNLKLVQPTPPVSRASTPFFEPPETIEEEAKEPLEDPPTPEGTSVDDATHKAVEVTPAAPREDPAVTTTTYSDRPRRKVRDYSDSDSDGQAKRKPESVGKPDHSTAETPSYDDDYEFAATLAASAQEAGFDPSLVIDNPSYHRRDSPPSSESREADAGSYDFDATTETSSEKRRRERRSRKQSPPMTAIPRNDSAIVDDIVSQVEQPSSSSEFKDEYKAGPESSLTRETNSKVPVEPVEDEPSGKKDRKKRSKRRSNGLIETDSSIPTIIPEGTEDTLSISKSESSQRENGDRHGNDGFQVIDTKEPGSGTIDDFEDPKKRKKKSKRNKVNRETDDGRFDVSPEVGRSIQDTPAKGRDTNTDIASREHGSDNVSESFLGMRPDPPPPPDPEPGGIEAPDFEALQSSERSQDRPSRVFISESQQSPGSITSPTRVPVHFKRPPPITPLPRSSSQSPLSSSRSMSEVIPQTKPRPRSMELKKFSSSKEIRPLWLVERHQSHQEPSPEENYPPLPESDSTSAASSVHNLGESDSEQGRDLQKISSANLQDSLRTDEQSAPDMLDSQTTTPTAASFADKPNPSTRSPTTVDYTPEIEQGIDLIETPKPRKSLSRKEVVDEMVTAATSIDEHPEENQQNSESKRRMPLVSPENDIAFRDPFVDEYAKNDLESTQAEESVDTADSRQPETALDPVVSPFDRAVSPVDESDAIESGHDVESQQEEQAAKFGEDPSIERFIESSVDLPEWTQSPIKVSEPVSATRKPDENENDNNLQFISERERKKGKGWRSSTAEELPTQIVLQQDATAGGREQPEEKPEATVVDTQAEILEDDALGFTTKKKGKKGKKSRQKTTEKPLESVPSNEGTVANFFEASDSPQQQDVEASVVPTKEGDPEDDFVQLTRKKGKKGQKGRQILAEEASEPELPKEDTVLGVAQTFFTPEQQASETPVPSAPAQELIVAESPQEETVLDVRKTPGNQEQQAVETLVQPVISEPAEEDDSLYFSTKKNGKKGKKGKEARQSVYEPQAEIATPDVTTDPIAEELDGVAKPLDERRALDAPEDENSILAPVTSRKKGKKSTKQKSGSLGFEADESAGAPFSNISTTETREAAILELRAPEEPLSQPVVHGMIGTDRSSGAKVEEAAHPDAHQNVETNEPGKQTPKITAETRDLTSFEGDVNAELQCNLGPAKIRKSQELMESKDQDASIDKSMRALGKPEDRVDTEDQPEQITQPAFAASNLEKSPIIAGVQSISPRLEDIDGHETSAALTQVPKHDPSQLATISESDSQAARSPATIGIDNDLRGADVLIEDLPEPDRNMELRSGPEGAQTPEVATPKDVVTLAPTKVYSSQLSPSPEIGKDIVPPAEQEDTSEPQTKDVDEAQFAPKKNRKEKKKAKKAMATALDAVLDPISGPEALESTEAQAADLAPSSSITRDEDLGQSNEPHSGEQLAEAEPAKTHSLELRPPSTQEDEHRESTETPFDFPTAEATGAVAGSLDLDNSDSKIAAEDINDDLVLRKTKKDKKQKKKPQASEVAPDQDINEPEPSSVPSLDNRNEEFVTDQPGLEEAASSGPGPASQNDSETVEGFMEPKGRKNKKKSKKVVPFALDDVAEAQAGEDDSVPYDVQTPPLHAATQVGKAPAETDLTESKDLEPDEQLQQTDDSPATSERQKMQPLATEDANLTEVAPQADEETSSQVFGQEPSSLIRMEPSDEHTEHHPADDLLPSYPSETHKDDLNPESLEATSMHEATPPAPLEEPAKSPAKIQGFAPVPESAVSAEADVIDETLPLTTKAAKRDKKKSKKRQAISWNDEATEPPSENAKDSDLLRPIVESETTTEALLTAPVPESTAAADIEAIDKDLSLTKKSTKDKKKAKKRHSLSWDEDINTESPAEVVAETSEGPESIRSVMEDEPFTKPQETASVPNTTATTAVEAVGEASPLTKKASRDKKKAKKRQTLSWDEEPLTEPTFESAEMSDEALKEPEPVRSAVEHESATELQESAPGPDTRVSAEVTAMNKALSSTKSATKARTEAQKRQAPPWDEEPIVAPPAGNAEVLQVPQESDSSRAIVESELIPERQGAAPIASDREIPEVEPIDEAPSTTKKSKKDKKKAKKKQTFSWGEEPTDPPAESTEGAESIRQDAELFEPLKSMSPESESKMERDEGDAGVRDEEGPTSDPVEALAATGAGKVAEPDVEMLQERSSEGAGSLGLDPDIANDVNPKAIDELVTESTAQDISREQTHEQGPVSASRDVDLAPLESQRPQDDRRSSRSQESAVAEPILEKEKSVTVDDRLPTSSQALESEPMPAEELRTDDQTSRADEGGVTEDFGRPLGTNRSSDSLDEPGEQYLPGKDVFEDDRIPSKERVQAFTDDILASQAAETGDVRETGLAAPATVEEPSEPQAEQSNISGPPTPLSAGSADLLDVEEQREYDEQYARELERQLQGQMPDPILGQEIQGPGAHRSEYAATIPLESSSHEPRETLAKATSLEDIVEEPLPRSVSQPEKPETQGTQEIPFQPTKRSKKGKKGKKSQQPVIWEDETATAGILQEPEPAVDDPDIDDSPLNLEEDIVDEAYRTQAEFPIAISPSAARRSSKAEGDNGDYFGIQPTHPAEEDVGGTGDEDRRHSLSVEPAQTEEERNEPDTEPRGMPEEASHDQGNLDDGAPLSSKKSEKGEEKNTEGVGDKDRSQSIAAEPSQLTQEPEALVADSRDPPLEVPNEQEPADEWQPLPSKKSKKGKKSRKASQANEDGVAGPVEEERGEDLSAEPAQPVQESMLPTRDVQADPPDDNPTDDWEPSRTKKSKKGKNSRDASMAEVVGETSEIAQPQRRDNGEDDLDGLVPISQAIARSAEATSEAETRAIEERADGAWEPLPTKKDRKGKKSRKASKGEVGGPKVDQMVRTERSRDYEDAQEDLDAKGAITTQDETEPNEALIGGQTEPVDRQEEADDWTPLPAKKGKKGKKSRSASKAEFGLPKVDQTLEVEQAEQLDREDESNAQVSTPQGAAENYRLGDIAASASVGATALVAEGLSRKRSKKDKKNNKQRNEDAAPLEDDVTTSGDLEMTEQPSRNEDLTQMEEQRFGPTAQYHAESAPLPESVQAEQTQEIRSIDVDEQRQRDSAIHVQMSPSLPEESVHRLERDSGYPATEPSPTRKEQQESQEEPTERDVIESYADQPESPHMDIEREWAPNETSWPANKERDSKGDSFEWHMGDAHDEKSELPLEDDEADVIASYSEAVEGDRSDPLITTEHGQGATEEERQSEAPRRVSTPPIVSPIVKAKRRKSRRSSGEAYDSDDSADSGFDVQKRRRRIQALAEEPREPSPVSSTTKDRSSALFDSSPSGRDGLVGQLREQSPVDAPASAAIPKDAPMQHEHTATTGETASSFGNTEGARTQEGPSLFGGHAHPQDLPPESKSPVQMVERGRQGLRRVSERSIEQSPGSPLSRKDKRDISDIGTPEQGVKTRRKSRRLPRSEGTPSSGGEDLRSQPSLTASDDKASSVGFQESMGRNTDRVPSRLSNISGARSLRSPGIGSPDSIHAIIRTPEQVRSASGQSIRSSGTPPLRRVDRSISGDLRAASRKNEARIDPKPKIAEEAEPEEAQLRHQLSRQQLPPQLHQDQDSDDDVPLASSSGYDPVKDKGKTRADPDMADYEGFGAIRGQSPMSPTRPPSMRKRQSMHFAEMEQRLAMLASENSLLQNAKSKAEKRLDEQARDHSQQRESYEDAIKSHKAYIADRDNTLTELNHILHGLRQQVAHLTSVNEELVHAREEDDRPPRHAWEQSTRELADLRIQHSRLTTEHEGILTREIDAIREEKDTELHQLREELEEAKSQIRKLQQQILSSRSTDDIVEHDEDYFDAQCQELCRHLTSWVTRFSKLSDNKRSFLAGEIRNEAHQALFEDCMLDGSEVDDYLQERHRRRDVFMAVTMALIFKHVFARYLFGMDREHRQKLKSLDKTLQEVGPPAAVHKWRATTLNLLSKRPTFQREREQEADAVVEDIWTTLSSALPPPPTSTQTAQCRESLRRIINLAVDLSIDMRLQRAEYSMLPPPEPEFDPTTGDIVNRLSFTAVSMNERSGAASSNEELEEAGATLRMVLFPLVVKNTVAEEGEEEGEEQQIVVCPAQVHVTPLKKPGRGAGKTVRVLSAQGGRSEASYSVGDDDGDTRMEGGMF